MKRKAGKSRFLFIFAERKNPVPCGEMPINEIIATIALTRLNYFSLPGLVELYRAAGSAAEIVVHKDNISELLPDAHPRLKEALVGLNDALKRAEAEYHWAEEHHVEVLTLGDERYPQRLAECEDAPLVLFYRGSADLNSLHIVSMVGTRKATRYGEDLINKFCQEMRAACPDVVIVSGLAYGIDIMAHRAALQNGLDTIGVVAHGLDDIYPAHHRDTAIKMINQGGLLTEFTTQTRPEKMNFVRRNRIVAGMSDATILVESAAKGGGLITMSLARSYGRDSFAFPGAVGAPYSEGCNNLIRDNGAQLITSANDFVSAMGWTDAQRLQEAREQGIERQIFPDLSDEEKCVVEALQKTNDQQINMLSVLTNLPIAQLSGILFTLEMKGVVRTLAGAQYHLCL